MAAIAHDGWDQRLLRAGAVPGYSFPTVKGLWARIRPLSDNCKKEY